MGHRATAPQVRATLIERRPRFLILLAFPGAVATADAVRHAITTAFASLPAGLRRTLTWVISSKNSPCTSRSPPAPAPRCTSADAHAPWQRGSNENINGLLRDYFPKSTDLSVHTAENIQGVAIEVNHRPRKTLDWNRPADLFANARIAA